MIDSSSPNQPIQNYEIVNPSLETQVANLLPSVAGYGGNLRSTNTIIPIVDLTSAAEGTALPEALQFALAFGSQTAFEVEATTTDLANSPGFWRVFGTLNIKANSSAHSAAFNLTDSVSNKEIFGWDSGGFAASNDHSVTPYNFVIYLAAGQKLQAISSATSIQLKGSFRQVADNSGVLVDPSGFS